GAATITAEDDAGDADIAHAGHVVTGAMQMHLMPDGWRQVGSVRIAGQQCMTGGRLAWTDHPVVAPRRSTVAGARGARRQDRFGPSCPVLAGREDRFAVQLG